MNSQFIGKYVGFAADASRQVAVISIEVRADCAAAFIAQFGIPSRDIEIGLVGCAPKEVFEYQPLPTIAASNQPAKKPLRRSAVCAIACNDAQFRHWVLTNYFIGDHEKLLSEEIYREAVNTVRQVCGIESRKELDTNEEAGVRWINLHSEYEAATASELMARRHGN